MPHITLSPEHATELTELLEFLNAWLTSDYHPLNASPHQYVGHPAYDIERLKADLARFTFLLDSDHDGTLFQPPTAP